MASLEIRRDDHTIFVRVWRPDTAPKGLVQIVHGLAEHSGRYARFAEALSGAGYAVYAHDHRGHGERCAPADLGFFALAGGWRKLLDDIGAVGRQASADFPGVARVFFGHSMGSFLGQTYLAEHGSELAGAILSGTSGPPPAILPIGKRIVAFERWRLGPRAKSPLLHSLLFGEQNKPFKPARTPFDWLGYAELALALGIGQGAIEMSGHGSRPLAAWAAAFVSVAAFILFLRRYRRRGSGILNLKLLRIRTFRISVTAGSVARAGLGGVPFLLPLLLQLGFGYNAFRSGLVTFLVAIGSMTVRPILSFLMRMLGCRRLLLANSLAAAAGLLGFLLFRDRASVWLLGPYVFVFGLLRSVQMSTMNALSYTDMEKRNTAEASTIATLAQRISIGLGVNVAATVLAVASGDSAPTLNAFSVAFAATAVLVLIAGGMFMRLHANDGWQISSHIKPKEVNPPLDEPAVSAGPTDV